MEFNDIIQKINNGELIIESASYIGAPEDNTIMFITQKVEKLLVNLKGHSGCIVFAENGVSIPDEICVDKNIFIFSDNPQFEYAKCAEVIFQKRLSEEKKYKYTLTSEGYYIGENTEIGEGAYIEPECLIGHGVRIGNDARILKGAVIKNSVIGDRAVINEYAVVGSYGFTMSVDENGNKFRIPTLGKVIIGNDVEIGVHDNISCGSGGNTVIEDFAKIDTLVHLGHDVHIEKNVELAAGTTIGGFVHIKQGTFAGLNSCVRNRIEIGEESFICMGSAVAKSIPDKSKVIGSPARGII